MSRNIAQNIALACSLSIFSLKRLIISMLLFGMSNQLSTNIFVKDGKLLMSSTKVQHWLSSVPQNQYSWSMRSMPRKSSPPGLKVTNIRIYYLDQAACLISFFSSFRFSIVISSASSYVETTFLFILGLTTIFSPKSDSEPYIVEITSLSNVSFILQIIYLFHYTY